MVRNVFMAFCFIMLVSSCTTRENARIEKVEHFYIASKNSQNMFHMLTEQFGLPVVWDYQDWGGFSSGGITLGNVVIELLESRLDQTQTQYGIALEPSHSVQITSTYLDSLNILHGRINKASEWSTMSLNNLLPDNINLFLCDYYDRDFVTLDRKKAIAKLVANDGGTLGIQFLKEIVISMEDPSEFELAKIRGVVKKGNEFHFSDGPNLRLIKSDTPSLSLMIKVNSIDKAKLELEAFGLRTIITKQGLALNDEILETSLTLFE